MHSKYTKYVFLRPASVPVNSDGLTRAIYEGVVRFSSSFCENEVHGKFLFLDNAYFSFFQLYLT